MTSLFFSLQAHLARLRESGEIHPREHGAGVSPAQYLKVIALGPEPDVSLRALQNLLFSKRLYTIDER